MRNVSEEELLAVCGGGKGNNASAHNGIIGGMLKGAGAGAVAAGSAGALIGGPAGAAIGAAFGAGIGALAGAFSGYAQSSPPKMVR